MLLETPNPDYWTPERMRRAKPITPTVSYLVKKLKTKRARGIMPSNELMEALLAALRLKAPRHYAELVRRMKVRAATLGCTEQLGALGWSWEDIGDAADIAGQVIDIIRDDDDAPQPAPTPRPPPKQTLVPPTTKPPPAKRPPAARAATSNLLLPLLAVAAVAVFALR